MTKYSQFWTNLMPMMNSYDSFWDIINLQVSETFAPNAQYTFFYVYQRYIKSKTSFTFISSPRPMLHTAPEYSLAFIKNSGSFLPGPRDPNGKRRYSLRSRDDKTPTRAAYESFGKRTKNYTRPRNLQQIYTARSRSTLCIYSYILIRMYMSICARTTHRAVATEYNWHIH